MGESELTKIIPSINELNESESLHKSSPEIKETRLIGEYPPRSNGAARAARDSGCAVTWDLNNSFNTLALGEPGEPQPRKTRIAYYLQTYSSRIKLASFPFSVGFGPSFDLSLPITEFCIGLPSADSWSADAKLGMGGNNDSELELFRFYMNANCTLDLITINGCVFVNGARVERFITLVREDVITVQNSPMSLKLHLEYELAIDARETTLIKAPIFPQESGVALVYVFALYGPSCDSARIRQRSATISSLVLAASYPASELSTPCATPTPLGSTPICKMDNLNTPGKELFTPCRKCTETKAGSGPIDYSTNRLQELQSLSLPGSPAIKIHSDHSNQEPTPHSCAHLNTRTPEIGRMTNQAGSPATKIHVPSRHAETSSDVTPSHLLWATYMRERMQELEEKVISPSASIASIASEHGDAEYFTCLSVPNSATLRTLKRELDKQLLLTGVENSYSMHLSAGRGRLDAHLDSRWVFQLDYLCVDSEHAAPMRALRLARIKPIRHSKVLYIHFH